jgi:hypothetical protein
MSQKDCKRCNGLYSVADGYEDTGYCNPCAQAIVDELPAHDREVAAKALEAAAKICDETAETYPVSGEQTQWSEAQVCAAAIRAMMEGR